MSLNAPEEFIVGRYLVRISSSTVGIPGVDGWIGVWSVFSHPREPGAMPVRYGDTGFQPSPELAISMARTTATATARSL